ncbi:MAG: TonB-dependent receptor plug domain-containing protein [Emticicia sp.]|nr:TonB-dependent receptor plug domain-containing protein [Emticicia sp.]
MRYKGIPLLLVFAFSSNLFAQQIKIKISDGKKNPIIGATVQLKDRADSTKTFNKITDTTGIVVFNLKSGNSYVLTATSIGYKAISKGIKALPNSSFFTYEMTEDSQQLSGVSVVARKPLMKQEDDMTIIDPEPLAATSTSAFEIMEKTPGLFVDQDGNIYISSATPATIFINGREQKMSAADIATVLKSLPPNSIEKIEVMRTPSAKYDASGSGGVVNVVLKKGVNIGRTGSVNTGMNQGRFGNQFVGINLNNNSGGQTSYLNLNYNLRDSYEQVQTTRQVSDGSVLSQESYTTTPANVLFLGYGLGRELNEKWQLNYDGRLSLNGNKTKSENLNKQFKTNENEFFSNNLNNVLSESSALNFNQEIETKYKIDTLGSEWTVAASYNYFERTTDQNLATNFTIPRVFFPPPPPPEGAG